MSNQYFRFRQFTIFQDRCAMKVGTDGVLLGCWAKGGKRILDIGTGTGLIALMMAQRCPMAHLTGIDIDEVACSQAHENVNASPFNHRIDIRHISLQDYAAEVSDSPIHDMHFFDAIVSNPPFFFQSLKSPDNRRKMARHTDTLPYWSLFSGVTALLSSDGEFSAIIPFDCLSAFISEAERAGLHLSRLCAVRTTPKKNPRRYLLSFRRQQEHKTEVSEEVLENASNQRSLWYKTISNDFYL